MVKGWAPTKLRESLGSLVPHNRFIRQRNVQFVNMLGPFATIQVLFSSIYGRWRINSLAKRPVTAEVNPKYLCLSK